MEPPTRVRRRAERGRYAREVVHAVLDEALVCHVGVVVDGQPYVIPTTYARVGDQLYVHGAGGRPRSRRRHRAAARGRAYRRGATR